MQARSAFVGPLFSRRATIAATLVLVVFVTLADIWPLDGSRRFIGHADEAHLAMVARNIEEGRGAVADVVWLYTNGGMPGNAVTHPEDYWSIYAAAIIAVLFKLFGATRSILLLSASLFKTGTALLSGLWAARLAQGSRLAFFVTVATVSLWPTMLRTVKGLSDVYLTFFVLLFFTALARGILTRSRIAFLFAGAALGIAIAVKPSGAILLGIAAIFAMVFSDVMLAPRNVVALVAGAVAALIPLAVHNFAISGHLDIIRPPAFGLAVQGNYIADSTGNHELGIYNPEASPDTGDAMTHARLMLKRAIKWLHEAALGGSLIPLFMAFFTSHFLFEGALRSNGDERAQQRFIFGVFVLSLIAAAVALAFAVHYEERYWNFLFPPIAVLAVVAMIRTWRGFAAVLLVLVVANAGYYYYSRKEEAVPAAYAELSRLVPADSIIMTPNPWETTFHTRIRSVATPYTDRQSVVFDVATRYGVDYLVFVDRDARHPLYYSIQNGGQVPDDLTVLHFSQDLVVAKFNRDRKPRPPVMDTRVGNP